MPENTSLQWAVKVGRLFTGKHETLIHDAIIYVHDGLISKIGPTEYIEVPSDLEIIDLGQKTAMPGLIDAHVHMMFNGGPQSIQDARLMTDEQAISVGQTNARRALVSGLTTVRDCGDRGFSSLDLRDSIQLGVTTGPTILCAGPPITTTGGQLWWAGIQSDTENELRKAVHELCSKKVDFVKLMGSGGNSTLESDPTVAQYFASGFKTVADEAHALGLKVAVHAHSVDSIRFAVDAQMDTIEHCTFMKNDTIEYCDDIIKDIVAAQISVSLAMPATWYRLTQDEMLEPRAHPEHLWERRYDTIRQMHKAGVRLIVSTDQGSTATQINELYLLMEFLAKTIGMPNKEILYGVTSSAAQALGQNDKIGTLESNKKADIILVNGNPLTNISVLKQPFLVIKDGVIVAKQGELIERETCLDIPFSNT